MSLPMDRSSSTTRILGFEAICSEITLNQIYSLEFIITGRLIRYYKLESRPCSYLALDGNLAAVPHCNFFHKGQAQTEAALLLRFWILTAIEFLKNLLCFLRRNAAPLIDHTKIHAAGSICAHNSHGSSLWAVFDSICDQVAQGLVQQ